MARSSRLAPLIFAGWLAFLPVPSAGEEVRPPAGSGPVIASISFQVPSPFQVTYEECYGLVTLRPGDRLTEEKVKESIRRLYTRSVFREVTAYVREDGGKADLLFFLRPVPLVAEVEVSGQKSVTAAQILSASRIRRGGLLEERDLAEAETAVRSFLAGRGFTTGKCTIQVSCSVVNGAGKVRITVEEGKPGLVETLAVPGASFFPPERLAEILGVEAGKPFDFQRWEKGLTRLRVEYKKSGFLTVRVEGSVPLCGNGSGLCPRAEVVEGRRYDVRWEGVREFSPEKLAKVSGLYGTEEVTEGALAYDLRERILAYLPAGKVPAGTGRRGGRGGERREGAVDREGPGGTGWIHQGNPVRGEPRDSRGGASAANEYPGTGDVPLVHGVREVQRGGMEPGPERHRRLLPEGRVRPDEDRRRGRRVGRERGDHEGRPDRGGNEISPPGDPVPGERPLPAVGIPRVDAEQGRGVRRLRRAGARPGGDRSELQELGVPGCDGRGDARLRRGEGHRRREVHIRGGIEVPARVRHRPGEPPDRSHRGAAGEPDPLRSLRGRRGSPQVSAVRVRDGSVQERPAPAHQAARGRGAGPRRGGRGGDVPGSGVRGRVRHRYRCAGVGLRQGQEPRRPRPEPLGVGPGRPETAELPARDARAVHPGKPLEVGGSVDRLPPVQGESQLQS